jgi:hypothetical protein
MTQASLSFCLILKWLVSFCVLFAGFISRTSWNPIVCGQVCTLIMHYALYVYVWICLCLLYYYLSMLLSCPYHA